MRRVLYLLVAIFAFFNAHAQGDLKSQITRERLYDLKDIYDSTYGIQLFDKYNAGLGGDSVRKNLQGYMCNGFVQDHYKNGALLHKGFYADGVLTLYTNYYPSGQEERTYKAVTERKNELKKFYSNGKLRSDVQLYDGNAISYHDFYENGNPSYVEEYDKKHERLLQRNSYSEDGKPTSTFMPIDGKGPVRYAHIEYFPGGTQVKEQYTMLYSSDALDYVKDGEDKTFDEKGNLVSDVEYINGQENRKIK